jgi:hypothetical protein
MLLLVCGGMKEINISFKKYYKRKGVREGEGGKEGRRYY